MKRMKLYTALKLKNRIAGELRKQQEIFTRENSRRSDSVSTVDREALWLNIARLYDELVTVKSEIAKANVPIYSKITKMAELKGQISFLGNLNTREGEELVRIGFAGEAGTKTYTWTSHFNRQACDAKIDLIQAEINTLQDEIDEHNASTFVEIDFALSTCRSI